MIVKTLVCCGVGCLLSSAALAQEAKRPDVPTTNSAEAADAKYTEMIAKRADDAVGAANIIDAEKAANARKTVAAYYRDLRDLDTARDAQVKTLAKGSAEAKAVADAGQAKKSARVEQLSKTLSADLTPEQVEAVKDKIVYNVRQVTYNAYLAELPKLTDEQKAYIAAQLLEARELALTGGSSKEKHGWFDKYKGRINNYLSKQGYDMKAEGKAWQERNKAAATQNK